MDEPHRMDLHGEVAPNGGDARLAGPDAGHRT
jgi:hypothetical protein